MKATITIQHRLDLPSSQYDYKTRNISGEVDVPEEHATSAESFVAWAEAIASGSQLPSTTTSVTPVEAQLAKSEIWRISKDDALKRAAALSNEIGKANARELFHEWMGDAADVQQVFDNDDLRQRWWSHYCAYVQDTGLKLSIVKETA